MSNRVIQYEDRKVDGGHTTKLTGGYSIPQQFRQELSDEAETYEDPLTRKANQKAISARENSYQQRKYDSMHRLEDESQSEGYRKTMEQRFKGKKDQEQEDNTQNDNQVQKRDRTPPRRERKRRWDVGASEEPEVSEEPKRKSRWEEEPAVQTSQIPVVDGIPLTEENLNILLPSGFRKIPAPLDYKPDDSIPPDLTSFNSLTNVDQYVIPEESTLVQEFKYHNPQLIHDVPGLKEIQFFKEADMKVFGKLITTKDVNVETLSNDQKKEIQCMKLILMIKNGSPQVRKVSLRQLQENARYFGADHIFNVILPLLMSKSLEDQERHLLVKVVGRVLFRLEELIRPYAHKILVVIMPLLIDEDMVTRLEGREIISNLSKAAGLAHMISVLRPDIDHSDDYVRNTVARTFAVVASSLGIQSLLPFLRAVCGSKKSWLARHTGVKIVQQIAILMGSSILPYLNGLVGCIGRLISDENLNVRTMAAMAISNLAESSAPYGFDAFEKILDPLWQGLRRHRGRGLAAFLRALGYIIPLMDEEYSNYYTREVFRVLTREFSSPEDEMKRTVLRIINQCCSIEVVDGRVFKEGKLVQEFFQNFWNRRTALDSRISRMCVDASVSLSNKIGPNAVIGQMLVPMKDESETFRRMAVETSSRIVQQHGSFDLDDRTVERLLDALLFSFQHQTLDDSVVLNGFGNILVSLGVRIKPHLMSIMSAVLYRLKNKTPEVRQQAADLIARTSVVLKICDQEDMLVRLSSILYESLGEVYPDVLGSILNAMRSVIQNLGVELVNPPIAQILATLTPILRNRHEKVQETTINLIGDIADKGKEYINHREWMRISFELLEMLKARKKQIRKSANTTFGLIARAIGPADVLVTLLNNLRVQERQLRVCTAVAIGIVADTCSPYTVLPALMNEYRFFDRNVQNGVLKSLSFMFEYIGDMGGDYVYAVLTLLQDAFTDRDLVHRQTASTVVKHMALGCAGLGYEDAFLHYLNLIWPNVMESSPHVIVRILESVEAIRVAVGYGIVMNYAISGLYHPASKVRHAYWQIHNSMYLNNSDALVPYHPRLEAIGEELKPTPPQVCFDTTDYSVQELDMWI
ncbi:hypothetical protein OGAPHI_005466 [Ogataea philodendri]|uniref:Phosphatase PP2A regulatory subunit A/Splicing factor 3B subunit 1-like HEAT repeat domain-containing protein n=1 Tax=Ogataea philodendri TaxID=1378263 RepID=A0A9P8NYG3_9ASCO|nr:uncharacterized protein OGAPHI_005466 [Ogataea philodendri]KAH3662218.1 hypothetical protein OGAPHI_005466 [Ogataea philodendri]